MDQLLLLKLLEVLTETRSPSLGKGKGTREQDSTHQRLQLPSRLGASVSGHLHAECCRAGGTSAGHILGTCLTRLPSSQGDQNLVSCRCWDFSLCQFPAVPHSSGEAKRALQLRLGSISQDATGIFMFLQSSHQTLNSSIKQ